MYACIIFFIPDQSMHNIAHLYQTSSNTAIVNKRGVNFQPVDQGQSSVSKKTESLWHRIVEVSSQFLEELMSPPAIATVSFFFFCFPFCFLC